MDTQLILFCLIFLLVIGGIHFARANDEIPLILVLFNLLVLTRIYAIEAGSEWAIFDYGISLDFDLDIAYTVSQFIFLGTLVMFTFYLIFYKKNEKKPVDNSDYLEAFLNENKNIIIVGFVIFYIFKMTVGSSLTKGYSVLLTLANSSFIILLFLVYDKLKTNFFRKAVFGVLFTVIALSTYSTALRYQFLGWAIPIAIYMFRNFSPVKKVTYYTIGLVITFIFFSIAGAEREETYVKDTISEQIEVGIDRILIAEDVNFIDGFVMLYQVYPRYLNFHYGYDHLGIFLRPIPRVWWPGKPEGAWQQKYAQKNNLGYTFVTGISPTIYGVFYGEAGVFGIIIFSVLWAFLFNKYRKWSEIYSVDLHYILKGVFLASLLPFLRSGDLPGDIAIILMSYWPLIIFVRRYNRFVKERKEEESKELQNAIDKIL
jgi:hypothetical protein